MRQLPERIFLVFLLLLSLPVFENQARFREKCGFEFRTGNLLNEKNAVLIPEIEEEREGGNEEENASGSDDGGFCLLNHFARFQLLFLSSDSFFPECPLLPAGREMLEWICMLTI